MDHIALSDNQSASRYELRRAGAMVTWIERHPDYADLLAA